MRNMTHVQKHILVDEQDWNALPHGQRCEIVRQFLRDYHNALKGNLNDINLEILKVQIVTLENQKIKVDIELNSKRAILTNALKAQEEDRIKRMETEKEAIEALKYCINCGNIIPENAKKHKFSKGYVCNGCFLVSEPEGRKGWDNG